MDNFECICTEQDKLKAEILSRNTGTHPVVALSLVLRGIDSPEKVEKFIYPSFDDLYDWNLLPDIEKAVSKIKNTIEDLGKICIFGDYDTDGVTASAILYKQIKSMGGSVSVIIPSRHHDGYGLNIKYLDFFLENNISLVITVDNGINAKNEVDILKENGIDVIITDHHIPESTLPNATAIVACSRTDSQYPYKELCGAGIAFKVACALGNFKINHEYLGLAALATLADIVPLTDENRTIVKLGLPYVDENLGIRSIMEAACRYSKPDYMDAAFVISPRINASGRMGDAYRSFLALTEESSVLVKDICNDIEKDNNLRKTEEALVTSEIYTQYSLEYLTNSPAIIVHGRQWNSGILGIVASKFSEKFFKPVILFAENEDNELVGSGRSNDNIDLFESLLPFKDMFIKFGGHRRAVGITISRNNFPLFSEQFNIYLERQYSRNAFIRKYKYEQEIKLSEIDIKLIEDIDKLAPFGEKNERPVFKIQGVMPRNTRKIGKNGDHLESYLTDGGSIVRLISFRNGHLMDDFENSSSIDVLCNLQNNTFRGSVSPEINMIACNISGRINEECLFFINEIRNCLLYNNMVEIDKIIKNIISMKKYESSFLKEYNTEYMRVLYSGFKARFSKTKLGFLYLNDVDDFEILPLAVFLELGFFKIRTTGISFEINKDIKFSPLKNSLIYCEIIK